MPSHRSVGNWTRFTTGVHRRTSRPCSLRRFRPTTRTRWSAARCCGAARTGDPTRRRGLCTPPGRAGLNPASRGRQRADNYLLPCSTTPATAVLHGERASLTSRRTRHEHQSYLRLWKSFRVRDAAQTGSGLGNALRHNGAPPPGGETSIPHLLRSSGSVLKRGIERRVLGPCMLMHCVRAIYNPVALSSLISARQYRRVVTSEGREYSLLRHSI